MKSIFKWALRIVLALVVLLVIAGFTMFMIGNSKANKNHSITEGLLTTVPTDSTSLAHGKHLSNILGCTSCHGSDLSGNVLADVPPFTLAPPNITPGQGGVVADFSVEDWDRVIRHGVKPDGKSVIIMPSVAYNNFSDEDAAALISYLQSLDPVDNDVPKSALKPLGKIILATGAPLLEATPEPAGRPAVEYGANVEFGEYMVTGMCVYCHGQNLEGGPGIEPGVPAPSLLTASKWDTDVFIQTLHSGIKPNGDMLSIGSMDPAQFSSFTAEELTGIHMYLSQFFE